MQIGDKVRLIREVLNVFRGYTPKGKVVNIISPFEDGSCLATNNVGSVLRIYSKDFELIDWYKEDKEENEMERIDIRKSCSNDEYELEAMNYRDNNPIFFGIRNKNYRDYDVTVRISKYHLSLDQANIILAPFGYELYESTDWTKVEVGTEVVLWQELNSKATFYEYMEYSKQILVIKDGYVKVYNEDEVELC